MTIARKSVTAASIAASAAVLAIAGLHAPAARADDDTSSRTTLVRIGDVDVNTQVGAKIVFARLEHASAEVCGENDAGFAPLDFVLALKRCEQQAIAPAVFRINSRPLTALYYGHRGMPQGTVSVGPITPG